MIELPFFSRRAMLSQSHDAATVQERACHTQQGRLVHWMAFTFIALVLSGSSQSATVGAETQIQSTRPEGSRVDLTCGQLFVPAGLVAVDNQIELVVQLHGSAAVAEQNLRRSGSKAVLVSIMLNGLSSVYTKQFAESAVWNQMLMEVLRELERQKISDAPTLSRVTIVSFSAGFGGVREILKDEMAFKRIDALVMADSIYAGYVPESRPSKVEPRQMTGFLKFATEAVAGRKKFVISHCDLQPEGYASTGETADYLLRELGLQRESAVEEWDMGWQHKSRCIQNGLQIHGFAGETGPDHMKHLHGSWRLLQLAK